ncbi:DUF2059 domain-containing protein [Patescibacteria group bacterium]|nr:DUF2059 domain-containing protein [Patescibacteria group bacterium]
MDEAKKVEFFQVTGTAERFVELIKMACLRASRKHTIPYHTLIANCNMDMLVMAAIEILSELYTEEEMDANIAFYSSKEGQNTRKKMPEASIKLTELVVDMVNAAALKPKITS